MRKLSRNDGIIVTEKLICTRLRSHPPCFLSLWSLLVGVTVYCNVTQGICPDFLLFPGSAKLLKTYCNWLEKEPFNFHFCRNSFWTCSSKALIWFSCLKHLYNLENIFNLVIYRYCWTEGQLKMSEGNPLVGEGYPANLFYLNIKATAFSFDFRHLTKFEWLVDITLIFLGLVGWGIYYYYCH